MEYLGRIDQQVKIRGFRIELGEIEARLREHEAVREAVVVSRRDQNDNAYLCAYLVPVENAAGMEDIRDYLAGRLPEHMIPAFFIQLNRIPLTANGKLDRKALPEPREHQARLRQTYVAPQNEKETKIAAIWQEVLQQERVGTRDNFFEIGGDSLKAVQLKSKLEETFEVEIPVVALFEHMTIQSFAKYLEEKDKENEEKTKLDRGEAIARARDDRTRQRNKRRIKREG